MRLAKYLGLALLVAAALDGGAASAANICRAGQLSCATTMPVGGYCECTSRGNTQDGTVFGPAAPQRPVNSTSGGCGATPGSAGCR